MKKSLLVLFLLTSIIYSGFAANNVNINYEPISSSEMILQSINGNKSGFYLGYFEINASEDVEIKISSPKVNFIQLQGTKNGKTTILDFKLNGDLHKKGDSTILKTVNFADSKVFKYKFHDNNTYVLDLYLKCNVAFDKLDGNYILVGANQLKDIVVDSISLVINNVNTPVDNISIQICPNDPLVDEDGKPTTGVSTDPTAPPIVVSPIIYTSFTDMYDNHINESTYDLNYDIIHNNYYKAPIAKAKISIQNSDYSITSKNFSAQYLVSISSTGAFTNNYNSISYNLITEIGATNMSVTKENEHNFKLSNLKTGSYAYFPIYFNFGSQDKLRNAIAGTYTDTIKVEITPLV